MSLTQWLAWRALWWAWPRLTTDQQARFLVVVLTMEKRYDLLVTLGLGYAQREGEEAETPCPGAQNPLDSPARTESVEHQTSTVS